MPEHTHRVHQHTGDIVENWEIFVLFGVHRQKWWKVSLEGEERTTWCIRKEICTGTGEKCEETRFNKALLPSFWVYLGPCHQPLPSLSDYAEIPHLRISLIWKTHFNLNSNGLEQISRVKVGIWQHGPINISGVIHKLQTLNRILICLFTRMTFLL